MNEEIRDALEAIRDRLISADAANDGDSIGHILIALGMLVDVVEQTMETRS